MDADVIEADGGTRTAAITAAFVAVAEASRTASAPPRTPCCVTASPPSVSASPAAPVLDLDYVEDSTADVDLNAVRLGRGGFVEVQGTGEGGTFSATSSTDSWTWPMRGSRH